MQDVLKQAAAKLPALTSSPGYAVLLENLILEARAARPSRPAALGAPPPLAPRRPATPPPCCPAALAAPLPPRPPKRPARPPKRPGPAPRLAPHLAARLPLPQALTLLAETKVTVKGVASQGSVTQKARSTLARATCIGAAAFWCGGLQPLVRRVAASGA